MYYLVYCYIAELLNRNGSTAMLSTLTIKLKVNILQRFSDGRIAITAI
jgi:hypothetical protein